MGYHSERQIEQDELEAFCYWLESGGWDEDSSLETHIYDHVSQRCNERMYRDRRTHRFLAKVSGTDYLWNNETIVFYPDGGGHTNVIKLKNKDASSAFLNNKSTTSVVHQLGE
jgi:hypothetical protein